MKTIEEILSSNIGGLISVSPANLWKGRIKIKPVVGVKYKVKLMLPLGNRPNTIFTNNPSIGLYFFLLDRLSLYRKYDIANGLSAKDILTLMKICRTL